MYSGRSMLFTALLVVQTAVQSQPPRLTVDSIFGGKFAEAEEPLSGKWSTDGRAMLSFKTSKTNAAYNDLVSVDARTLTETVLVPGKDLIPTGQKAQPGVESFSLSTSGKQLLIYTNGQKVWRQATRGDYWVYDLTKKKLSKIAPNNPASSTMFADLSPDGSRVGYVFKNNIYVQDVETGKTTQLTRDGSETTINGTFDWVYEEELDCRNGWRWSPDGKHIAFWQLDSSREPIMTLLNDTDSKYPKVKRYPYPKVGDTNASARIGVVSAQGGKITWTDVTATSESGYLARMQWTPSSDALLIQKLNRWQNRDEFWLANSITGKARVLTSDTDPAYVETLANDTAPLSAAWINNGQEFLILSEISGYRHLYAVSKNTGKQRLVTRGNFDVNSIAGVDQGKGLVYFIASAEVPTDRYLYSAHLNGESDPVRVTPVSAKGWNDYDVSPKGDIAIHWRSSFGTPPVSELVDLRSESPIRQLADNQALRKTLAESNLGETKLLTLKTADGQPMDVSLILPPNFDPAKKYSLFFNVYGEPWGTTMTNNWGGSGYLFHQMLAQKGIIVASADNRGTPSPKGRAWRKSIYEKIGQIASDDQAAAAKQLSELPYVNAAKIGIWGWSGGGSMTLNMMFRHPEIYSLGIAVAPVPDMSLYDTIYQERYMRTPAENPDGFKLGSPINFAAGLRGKLLIVHGSGDDNVHFQGTERLINRLVELGKPFDLMVYPNRTHAISEGPGTTKHLYELIERYIDRW